MIPVQWKVRQIYVQVWWRTRSERRHWWQARPVLFGLKWDEDYRMLKAKATEEWKKTQWWKGVRSEGAMPP